MTTTSTKSGPKRKATGKARAKKGATEAAREPQGTQEPQEVPQAAQAAPDATTEAQDTAPKGKKAKAPKEPREELVVFAFRLTQEEREAIHRAAGPGKASKFVRALATAAARGDADHVSKMVEAVKSAS